MRILIISTFFPPLNSIASLRPYSFAKYWSLAGHEVTVLTLAHDASDSAALHCPTSSFSVLEVAHPPFISKLKRAQTSSAGKETKPSFKQKCLHYFRFKKGILNACRMPDLADFWIAPALRASKTLPTQDLVISTSGPYATHIIAHKIKKRGQAKRWVADFRDTWSDSFLYPGLFPFNWIEKKLETFLMRRADAISIVSEPLSLSFKERFGQEKVMVIENGFDPEDLGELPQERVFPNDEKLRIVHTGSVYLGKRDPTDLFLAIANGLKNPKTHALFQKIEVHFVGMRQANILDLIEKFSLQEQIKLTGHVPRKQALAMQRDADLLLFLPWTDPSVDGILTGKLFEYLSSKTPIISVGASSFEAAQRLIQEAAAGVSFFKEEPLREYLATVLRDKTKIHSTLDWNVVKRYERKHLAMKLLKKAFG